MQLSKGFKQFIDLMSYLSEMLLTLDQEEELEYKVLLLDKPHKLEPYMKRAYKTFQEETKGILFPTIQEIQTYASKFISGEFITEIFASEEEEKEFIKNEWHKFITSLRVYTMNMLANNLYLTSINQSISLSWSVCVFLQRKTY